MSGMSQPMQVFMSRATASSPERDEAGTPPAILEVSRALLGGFDLDPASSNVFQALVRAACFYDREQNGLTRTWFGRVWLNPPFAGTRDWCDKLEEEFAAGRVQSAVMLVNSNLGYTWYEELLDKRPAVQLRTRLTFLKEDGTPHSGPHKKAQTVVYYGSDIARFVRLFRPLGRISIPGLL